MRLIIMKKAFSGAIGATTQKNSYILDNEQFISVS